MMHLRGSAGYKVLAKSAGLRAEDIVAGMHDDHPQQPITSSQGLLRPGRWFWARALPWSIVLGLALWTSYKFVKGVGIDWGLGGSGIPTILGLLAALALYVLSVLVIERRTPDELGVARFAPELAAGFAFGSALFSAIMVVLLATGAYSLTGPTATAPWQPLIASLEGAVEELIFRGANFRLLWMSFGVWWALGLSSTLFGTLHLIQPGADLMGVIGVVFGGGIPMAALHLITHRLWAPIGYHIAWNFTEAYVFGAQVSGARLGPSLYQSRPASDVDPLWSGGAFGPEASAANVVIGFLVGAALLAIAKRRA
jgi:membrane protease YdiL (CAAX protease family)